MTKYAAVTSMNQDYYHRCGKVMISSYVKNIGKSIPLYVYNEDNFIPEEKGIALQGWNLGQAYENFIERHKNNRVKTFAKKAFSIIHAMNNVDCDRLIWIDGDCLIKQRIPESLLEEISLDTTLSSHFSVYHEKEGIEYHSCETGFFVLNKKHKGFEDFKNKYTEIYLNDKTEGLRRFYDGDVYGKTVELMEQKNYKTVNLNTGKHKTPMPRSVLGPYVQHFKAGVKNRINPEMFDHDL